MLNIYRILRITLALACIGLVQVSAEVLATHVDLARFMGDWYVIASIPLNAERTSYNGRESYRLDNKGRIQSTYTFRKGSFSGLVKTYHPVGKVYNHDTNAEWRMQLVWPFKSAYLIHYVSADYSTALVGRPNHKNMWILARTPHIPDSVYESLITRASAIGYDITKIRKVPQA